MTLGFETLKTMRALLVPNFAPLREPDLLIKSVVGLVVLLLVSTSAFGFEMQRMLIPRQSITITGGGGGTPPSTFGNHGSYATLYSRCLDLYRRAPVGTEHYAFVAPKFGQASVKVGNSTMPLQQAINDGKIQISGDFGSPTSLIVSKLVPQQVSVNVDEPLVITEDKRDDAEELGPFLAAHSKVWAAEPMLLPGAESDKRAETLNGNCRRSSGQTGNRR